MVQPEKVEWVGGREPPLPQDNLPNRFMDKESIMRLRVWSGALSLLFAVFCLVAGGCKKVSDTDSPAALSDATTHAHSSWWCAEHGVPEEVCGQCNAKVAADFKKKGDWCKEHDRPKSQCFKCDAKLKEKFAAAYQAKYGKEPPPTEDEEKKDDKTR
jgi:cobalt-zinc-cadmium efflux system membrane fusion protein